MSSIINQYYIQRWCWVLVWSLAWWVLGLNLIIYHFSAFLLFLYFFHESHSKARGVYLAPSCLILIGISAVYFFSIVIHLGTADTTRVIAALYNLSFWIMGAMLVCVLSNTYRRESIASVLKAVRITAWVCAGLLVMMIFLWFLGKHDVYFKTPLYGISKYLGRTSLIVNSLEVHPLLFDWLASVTRPRFNVFAPYPTAAGGTLMIFGVLLWAFLSFKKEEFNLRDLALMGLTVVGLFMTLSRMSALAFVISIGTVFLVQKKHAGLWIFFMAALLIFAAPLIHQFMDWLMGLRQGSTTGRIHLYEYSLRQLEGIDWILGKGVKAREGHFVIPVGSHSTYISMLYKTGVMGFLGFLALQASVLWRWLTLRRYVVNDPVQFAFWRGLGAVLISMSMWMVTEDIDAPQFLAFLYFSLMGIFEGLYRENVYGSGD